MWIAFVVCGCFLHDLRHGVAKSDFFDEQVGLFLVPSGQVVADTAKQFVDELDDDQGVQQSDYEWLSCGSHDIGAEQNKEDDEVNRGHNHVGDEIFDHVMIFGVTDFMGDDRHQLFGGEPVQQRIEQHDFLGLAETGEISVHLRRFLRGVKDDDTVEVDAFFCSEIGYRGFQFCVVQRREFEHQRHEHDDEQGVVQNQQKFNQDQSIQDERCSERLIERIQGE